MRQCQTDGNYEQLLNRFQKKIRIGNAKVIVNAPSSNIKFTQGSSHRSANASSLHLASFMASPSSAKSAWYLGLARSIASKSKKATGRLLAITCCISRNERPTFRPGKTNETKRNWDGLGWMQTYTYHEFTVICTMKIKQRWVNTTNHTFGRGLSTVAGKTVYLPTSNAWFLWDQCRQMYQSTMDAMAKNSRNLVRFFCFGGDSEIVCEALIPPYKE